MNREAIASWLKNPFNLILILILIIAFLFQVYYFSATKSQALWWDESEYMLKAKSIAFGLPDTGYWAGRPILFPVILSGFFFLGFSEIAIRFFLILISLGTVYLVFAIGKKLFDDKTAIVASFLFSFFYIFLFYSFRIMVDIMSLFLGLLAFYFFLKKGKYLWFSIPLFVIATFLRFPLFWLFIVLFIYILFTEEKWSKNKNYWISAALGIIISLPFLIWSYFKYGNPLYSILIGGGGALATPEGGRFGVFMQYINYLPHYAGYLILILFVIGFLYTLLFLLGLDLLKKDEKLKRDFLIFLWIIIPLIYFGFFVNHFEDRYLFMIFPVFFMLVSVTLFKISNILNKYYKYLGIIFIVLFLLYSANNMNAQASSIITAQATSYSEIKDVGLWIKDNSQKGDSIISAAVPALTYYSEKAVYSHEQNLSAELNQIKDKKVKYIVITNLEKAPDWVVPFFSSNQTLFKPAYQSYTQARGTFAVVFSTE